MDLNTVTELLAVPGPGAVRAWQRGAEPGDVVLGGGSWLFSQPQPDARRLVDLTTAGWEPITARPDGVELAATCTLAQLSAAFAPGGALAGRAGAPLVQACCEALLGSFKVWNVATVGGNLCSSLPAGPMTSLAGSLDGVCTVWTPDGGSREVAALDLVTGDGTNVLAPGEVLRSVLLPAGPLGERTALRRGSLSPLGRSAALVVGRASGARLLLTVTAATRRPVRLAFDAPPDDAALATAVDAAVPAALWHDDVHGLPAWRRHLTHRFARQLRDELTGEAA